MEAVVADLLASSSSWRLMMVIVGDLCDHVCWRCRHGRAGWRATSCSRLRFPTVSREQAGQRVSLLR